MIYDYIIAGQGLAGSFMAWELIKRNFKILVIDPATSNSSSVAPGVFNPVTGRRMVQTWLAESVFPYTHKIYSELESKMGIKLLYSMPIIRGFNSLDERDIILKKMRVTGSIKYVSQVHDTFDFPGLKLMLHGALEFNNTGYVDTPKLLDGFRKMFGSIESFEEGVFDFNKFSINQDGLLYKNHEARNIIFSEGTGIRNNPYFNWVPIVPTKGEVLTIESTGLNLEKIITKSGYIVPSGNNTYKVGGTYDREDTSSEPTSEGKDQILEIWNKMADANATVVDHTAGLRPATPDRRPVVGGHPEFSNLYVFNGMGTKGITLAPFLAAEFAEFLTNVGQIRKEVLLQRFYIVKTDWV